MSALIAQNISVAFGPLMALDDVSAKFLPGEIHAVLGENGAGKSTLMNVLSGQLRATRGAVQYADDSLGSDRFGAEGVAMVHQHFMLVPDFTVAENLSMSQLRNSGSTLDHARLTARHRELARTLSWEIPFESRTRELPVGIQQRVEILKALVQANRVLILDEPTAVLNRDEVEDLFRVLRELKAKGLIVILIAHKLREIMAVADRATVLRRGKLVGEKLISETTASELAHMMLGSDEAERPAAVHQPGEVIAELKEASAKGDRGELALRSLSLEVKTHEILGIAGVEGNGQIELAEVMAGIRSVISGKTTGPKRVAYIPQDRQAEGLALELSVKENFLLAADEIEGLAQSKILNRRRVDDWVQAKIQQFNIKVQSTENPARALSGGNQQKIVVSRELSRRPELVIAVNPTRGLDFLAARFVLDSLQTAAREGAAVVLISSDADELGAVAHRIRTLVKGELVESGLRDALAGPA